MECPYSRYLSECLLENSLRAMLRLNNSEKLGQILLFLYAVPFVLWAIDVSTTFYAIEILGIAEEQNPLGWPLGVLGALTFYVPALAFTYLLLFKVKDKYSPYAAILITALAWLSGFMNLFAGLHNLGLIHNFSHLH